MRKVFQISYLLFLLFSIFFCTEKRKETITASLPTGIWRGVISLPEQEVPFNFQVAKDTEGEYTVHILNAEERLTLDSITVQGDTVRIPMHIFDAQLIGKVSGNTIEGYWIKNYVTGYRLPFRATHGIDYRFQTGNTPPVRNISGTYAIRFADRPDTLISVGIFAQKGTTLAGTVLTRSGDYRYLEGVVDGQEMKLSTFDGEHAYLLTAQVQTDSTLKGVFWSGKAKGRPWTAVKDSNVKLPTSESITYLKKGYDKIEFSFPGVERGTVSLKDPRYQGKVIILQLFGTWCPNCMDETKFLGPWYEKNRQRGVEIIGLSYEKKPDLEYARSRVQKMKQRLNINYDFAIAGTADNESASKSLPMLNQVLVFPTTISIDKQGNVRKVHTGFSGPGTGVYFEEFVDEFNLFVDKLLQEDGVKVANQER